MAKTTPILSLHRMFITLKGKNEQRAVEWLNTKLTQGQRNGLASYWTLHGFPFYMSYLKPSK